MLGNCKEFWRNSPKKFPNLLVFGSFWGNFFSKLNQLGVDQPAGRQTSTPSNYKVAPEPSYNWGYFTPFITHRMYPNLSGQME